jgi:hypothetical protein
MYCLRKMSLGYGMRTGARRTAASQATSWLQVAFAACLGIASLSDASGAADMAYVGLTDDRGGSVCLNSFRAFLK